jgi:hypothetical protein
MHTLFLPYTVYYIFGQPLVKYYDLLGARSTGVKNKGKLIKLDRHLTYFRLFHETSTFLYGILSQWNKMIYCKLLF